MQWHVWVAPSHLFLLPILNLRLIAAIKHPAAAQLIGATPLLKKIMLIYWWQRGCPRLGQEGVEAGWKPHYPAEEFPHCGELWKSTYWRQHGCSPPRSCSLFSKPGKSDLLFHHWGEEGRMQRRGGWGWGEGEKQRRDREAVRERARVPTVQLAASRACPQPRLKNKGAQATFQWKISRDGPDAPRDGYLTTAIKHERQGSHLCGSLWGRGEMKWWGKTMRSSLMGDPLLTPAHLC